METSNGGERFTECRHPAVLVDLCEDGAFDAILAVTEFPDLDLVRQLQCLQYDGDLVGVWACAVGMENEWLHVDRLFVGSVIGGAGTARGLRKVQRTGMISLG